MNFAELPTTQRVALIACTTHGHLRRTRAGYRPSTPGIHAAHTTRAIAALERAGLVTYTDGEVEVQPTPVGRQMVATARRTTGSIAA